MRICISSRLFLLVATGCGTKSQTCDVTLPWAADLLGPVHLVMFAALNTQRGETEEGCFSMVLSKPRFWRALLIPGRRPWYKFLVSLESTGRPRKLSLPCVVLLGAGLPDVTPA